MSRTILRACVALLAAGCAACAPKADQPQSQAAAFNPAITAGLLPVAGVAYRDSMPFLGRDLPLPPGEWMMLSSNNLVANGKLALSHVFMEQHAGNVVTRILSAVGATGSVAPSVLDSACRESDVIENNIRAADPTGEQDCLSINFGSTSAIRSSFARTPPVPPGPGFNAASFNNMFGQLDARNLVLPATIVTGTIALEHGHQSASVLVIYNPDADHVPPDPAPLRSTNGWARFNLDRDPAKKSYVARVLRETEAYRLRLIEALDRPAQMPEVPKVRSTWLPASGPG